jgi:quercetin dioxygenase-like cupin family protein
MSKKIEISSLDSSLLERSFGMNIRICQKLGYFNNKVALEYITLDPHTEFKPHHHVESDALILILSGHGYITDIERNKYTILKGSLAYFPSNVRHGFITEEEPITLVSVQSPPIKDLKTGEEDFIE